MGHLGVVWSHGAPVPSHCTWSQSHLTKSMRRSPRIGSQDTQCAPSKVTTNVLPKTYVFAFPFRSVYIYLAR